MADGQERAAAWRRLRLFAVCFFHNHDVHPDYERLVWVCDRCGSEGPKLWTTGAWVVDDLRRRWRRRAIPF